MDFHTLQVEKNFDELTDLGYGKVCIRLQVIIY